MVLLWGILLGTGGCIRHTIVQTGHSLDACGPGSGGDRVRLEWREEGGRIVGEWETSENYFRRKKKDDSFYLEQATGQSREVVWGGNFVGFPAEHFGKQKPQAAPVVIREESDAGVIEWVGQREKHKASGSYTFTPSASFVAAIRPYLGEEPPVEVLHQMAKRKVGRDYVQEAAALFESPPALMEVMSLHYRGLDKAALAEWKGLERGLNAKEILRLNQMGIGPGWVREFEAVETGERFSAEELVRLRQHGVAPGYVASWRKAGFAWKPDEIVQLRNHGIPADYAQALKEGGFNGRVEDVVRLRNHGVGADYYQDMRKQNARLADVDIIRLRNHGVPAEYVRGLSELGYELPADEVIQLRNYGVPIEYVRAVNAPGRKRLEVKAILEARQRGLSAETVRQFRE